MNQDSSFPPMLPPSTELGALLFAALPCLQEAYQPLASFAYHMTELSKLRTVPPVPPLSGLSGVEALISDKDGMLRSLSFYGRMFRMPLLSTIANLLHAMQFYQAYKDMIPGLFSAMNGGTSDLFSSFGGISPDLLSSLFSGFGGFGAAGSTFSNNAESTPESPVKDSSEISVPTANEASSSVTDGVFASTTDDVSGSVTDNISGFFEYNAGDSAPSPDPSALPSETQKDSIDLYDSLYPLLTPAQKEIYDRLMNTD